MANHVTAGRPRVLVLDDNVQVRRMLKRTLGRVFEIVDVGDTADALGDRAAASVVLEIDPASLATVRSFPVGAYPDMIALPTGSP